MSSIHGGINFHNSFHSFILIVQVRATALDDDVRSLYCNTVFIHVLYEFIDLDLKNENHTFNHILYLVGHLL